MSFMFTLCMDIYALYLMQRNRRIMNKYECLVKQSHIIKKIIRYFSSFESAFAWLKLEGYEVISVKEVS